MNYILKQIDDELWHRLKIMAAIQKRTLKDIIIDVIRREVEKFEK